MDCTVTQSFPPPPPLLLLLSFCCCCFRWSVQADSSAAAAVATRPPLLVVVSFDGFRPDYVRPDATPNLAAFREASASPPHMRSAFPTKTFVNHFTIATGLYPEVHGVLDNYAFDRNGAKMHSTYEHFHRDERIVPVWMQNECAGDDRHSGVMMWPGSEHPYQKKLPTYVQRYNRTMTWNSRVDTILSWIKDEKRPANLVLAYFEEPDRTSHMIMGSHAVQDQIQRVDTIVKYMLDRIKDEQLENEMNLVFLSDHGMDTVTYDRLIRLDDYVSNQTYKAIITGPNAFILPNDTMFDELYKKLTTGAMKSGTFDVYKKEELPERWHMKHTDVLDGIIYLLAKPGHAFMYDLFKKILEGTSPADFKVGAHGFDNEEPAMRAFFAASGPAFKRHFTARPFDNVDLCPLFGRVLRLPDDPRVTGVRPNGTVAGVEQLLLRAESIAATTLPSAAAPPPYDLGIMWVTSAAVLLHVFAQRRQ